MHSIYFRSTGRVSGILTGSVFWTKLLLHGEQDVPKSIQQGFTELVVSPDSYREASVAAAEEGEHGLVGSIL